MSEELANKIYLIRNTGSGKYLNVWGIDQVGNNRNVNQYDFVRRIEPAFLGSNHSFRRRQADLCYQRFRKSLLLAEY